MIVGLGGLGASELEPSPLHVSMQDVSEDSGSTELEKCFIVWEAFTAVGDNRLAEYHSWNNGLCNQFDIKAEQRKMNDSLIAEFGSAEVI